MSDSGLDKAMRDARAQRDEAEQYRRAQEVHVAAMHREIADENREAVRAFITKARAAHIPLQEVEFFSHVKMARASSFGPKRPAGTAYIKRRAWVVQPHSYGDEWSDGCTGVYVFEDGSYVVGPPGSPAQSRFEFRITQALAGFLVRDERR